MSESPPQARADASMEGDTLVVRMGGDWRITGRRPEWDEAVTSPPPRRVVLRADQLGTWDSSLALYLRAAAASPGVLVAVCTLSLTLLVATGLLGETFTRTDAITFAFVWAALLLVAVESRLRPWLAARQPVPVSPPDGTGS